MSCPDCFSGHVHQGTPKGHVTTLHGLNVYISEPSTAAKGIIVIIPDAFGWEFINNRILADHYAEKSKYTVYLPDFMKGTAVPIWGLDTMKSLTKTDTLYDWLVKPYHLTCAIYAMLPWFLTNRPGKSWPIVKSFFASVRENEGANLPVGAAGFCWGGKHTVLLAHGAEVNGKPLINAGFTGHPSLLSVPADIEKIKVPVSFALAELDNLVKGPQIEMIRRVVEGKGDGDGEVRVYLGAGHGFCVRADTGVRDVERQATEAEDQALEFFNRWFAKAEFD